MFLLLKQSSFISRLTLSYSIELNVDNDVLNDESDIVINVINALKEQYKRKMKREHWIDLYYNCPVLYNFINRSIYLYRILIN